MAQKKNYRNIVHNKVWHSISRICKYMVEYVWTVSDPDRWTFNYEIKDLLPINCIIIPACMWTVWCFRVFFRSIWNRMSCLSLSIWWHVIRAIGHLSSLYESVIELFSVCKKTKIKNLRCQRMVLLWFSNREIFRFSFIHMALSTKAFVTEIDNDITTEDDTIKRNRVVAA